MKVALHLPAGMIGRIFSILLLAMMLEFGVSTLLYERASHFSVRDDEARRLAEHLVISRKLIAEQAPERRAAMAHELTTNHYAIDWSQRLASPPPLSLPLDRMHQQIVRWEPELAKSDMRLKLASPGRNAVTTGVLALPDGSWLHFSTRQAIHQPNLAIERVMLAMIPAIALMLIGGLLVRQTLLPLRRLALAADMVGHGKGQAFHQEVAEAGPSEVRRVIAAFNRMRERIQRLITDRTEALAAVGHDLRTPLSRLRLRADQIEDPQLRGSVEADVEEMEAMVASLLAYLGGEAVAEQSVKTDVAVLCATVCDDMTDRGRDATYSGPPHFEAVVQPFEIKRAIVNLVENALHYGQHVEVSLKPAGERVLIRIDDDGPGIPEASLVAVMEPFVRLDSARARDTIGLGLGLPIVGKIVAHHDGRLTLSNRATGGLRAEIDLPLRTSNHL